MAELEELKKEFADMQRRLAEQAGGPGSCQNGTARELCHWQGRNGAAKYPLVHLQQRFIFQGIINSLISLVPPARRRRCRRVDSFDEVSIPCHESARGGSSGTD